MNHRLFDLLLSEMVQEASRGSSARLKEFILATPEERDRILKLHREIINGRLEKQESDIKALRAEIKG